MTTLTNDALRHNELLVLHHNVRNTVYTELDLCTCEK